MDKSSLLIGCIGQGYVGKNYGDDLEARGYNLVRYALEEPFVQNKEKIRDCDIVFIGVPTPTTPDGFDDSIVRAAVGLIGPGKIAVIKSTVIPGTTVSIQEQYPDRMVFYSPEFLSEVTARQDVAEPFASVVGTPIDDEEHRTAAEQVLEILPPAPFSMTCMSTEAEIFKYAHNTSGYIQVVFFNMLYDLAARMGVGWENIGKAIAADPYISNRYSNPVHKSGRGAGGNCFIKDFAALHTLYAQTNPNDSLGLTIFDAAEQKNIDLLRNSGKDLNLLKGVYGDSVLEK